MLAAVAQLHAPGKSKRALVRRSLTNPRISRNFRKLQNTNSAAAEIAIRFGPKILLECARLKTGPKYPCTRIDYGYKSSFSLNHYVQSLRPAHTQPRTEKSTQNSHLESGWRWDRVYSTLGVGLVIKVPVVHLLVPFDYSILRAHLGHT
jgi:hypothetical protein